MKSPGNGVSTPTPVQPGIVGNCHRFLLVCTGDSCGSITQAAGISLDDYYRWNPGAGSDCASPWRDYCVRYGV